MSTKILEPVLRTRSQQRVTRTRKRLLEAALAVFIERGVDAATVEEITQRADLGKGTLYRHFHDKYEIVIMLVEQAVSHLAEYLHSYDSEPKNIEGVLENLLNAHYNFFVDNSEEFVLLFQGRVLLKLERQTAGELEEPYARYLEEIEKMVSPYVSKKIDPAKIRRLACAVAGFVFGFFSFAMVGMDSDEIQTSIKPLRQVFVRSLSAFLGR